MSLLCLFMATNLFDKIDQFLWHPDFCSFDLYLSHLIETKFSSNSWQTSKNFHSTFRLQRVHISSAKFQINRVNYPRSFARASINHLKCFPSIHRWAKWLCGELKILRNGILIFSFVFALIKFKDVSDSMRWPPMRSLRRPSEARRNLQSVGCKIGSSIRRILQHGDSKTGG